MFKLMSVDRYKVHNIEVVVDKMLVESVDIRRLKNSVASAMKMGGGLMIIKNFDTDDIRYFSRNLMCADTGISYRDPAPHSFSFNSPHGACPQCNGLGQVSDVDINKLVPDKKISIYDGGIEALGKFKNGILFYQIDAVLKKFACDIYMPIAELSDDALNAVLNGYPGQIRLEHKDIGVSSNALYVFEGIIKYIISQSENSSSKKANKWAEQFISTCICPKCNGQRLNIESLNYKILEKNISELAVMELNDLQCWILDAEAKVEGKQKSISVEIFKEIRTRLQFLLDVGLSYLSLNRQSMTLSGGEAQRIRLATQIGSELVNVLYILDEPSIGLHQKDNRLLIDSLRALCNTGNSVLVVEHDQEIMEKADYIIDMGPKAGRKGGEVVAVGTYKDILESESLTASYLNGIRKIELPQKRRKGTDKYIELKSCSGNNLKNVDLKLPLGMLVCICGVSGSGKSSLINGTLYPILAEKLHRAVVNILPYKSIEGIENIDKVIVVDQSPIGRTPRSNPATYTGLFTDIRKIFEKLPESQIRGYGAGRFSFNVKGGRCEACKGAGLRTIEMNFLPDVYLHCDVCDGKRYNRETLEVRYRGKSIGDVLDMTINQAVDFFENISFLQIKLKMMQDVGLGYIKIGQACTTLSGGESQRIKLAAELGRKDTGNTLYILDEPTTGLHFEDIKMLMSVVQRLVDKGNTVVVVEHNLDVIKLADYVIDMGPEGGKNGGVIMAEGTPEEVAMANKSVTASFIAESLKL